LGGDFLPLQKHFCGVWPIEKHWESVLKRFTQQKINNGDRETAAAGYNA